MLGAVVAELLVEHLFQVFFVKQQALRLLLITQAKSQTTDRLCS